VLLLAAPPVLAQPAARPVPSASPKHEAPPAFYYLPSPTENAWLSMTCRWVQGDTGKAACHFVRLSLRSPSEADAALVAGTALKSVREEPQDLLSPARLASTCARVREGIPPGQRTPARQAVAEEDLKNWRAVCECKTRECRESAFERAVATQEGACQVDVDEFDYVFSRTGKNKWLSNPGPQGTCNVVRVVTLERKEGDRFWAFSSTVVTADDNDDCAFYRTDMNTTTRFAWSPESSAAISCRRIKVGW